MRLSAFLLAKTRFAGHKLEVTFPSGPRAVLPPKVKENLKVKGAWIVEALLPADGDYEMVVKVDGKDISGSPFSIKAECVFSSCRNSLCLGSIYCPLSSRQVSAHSFL